MLKKAYEEKKEEKHNQLLTKIIEKFSDEEKELIKRFFRELTDTYSDENLFVLSPNIYKIFACLLAA